MIELPSTLVQTDAITEAAQIRGMSVTDWAMDTLLTQASNHLQRGLRGWIEAEQAYVTAGSYPACTVTIVLNQGTAAEKTISCVRIGPHRVEAVAARDSHAGYDGDSLTTWQHGD